MWFPNMIVFFCYFFSVDKKAPSSPSSDQIKEFFFSHSAPPTGRQAVRQVVHAPPAQKSSADERIKVKAQGCIDRPPSGCHGDANKSSAPPPTSARDWCEFVPMASQASQLSHLSQ